MCCNRAEQAVCSPLEARVHGTESQLLHTDTLLCLAEGPLPDTILQAAAHTAHNDSTRIIHDLAHRYSGHIGLSIVQQQTVC